MKYSVPESVIEETAACPYSFSCLETGQCGDRPMCSVDYAIPDNILFLKTEAPADCPYRWPFGINRQVCKCPVRYFIWRRYKE